MKQNKKHIYILIDAPSQGMLNNGIMGAFTTNKLAEKAKGNRIASIVKIELNIFYNEGISNLLIKQIFKKA